MLSSSWRLPFGVDKLARVIEAKRRRKLPVLSLEDHERYGDTYGQYAGGLFTIVTRDSRIISSLLLGQPHNFGHGRLRKLCFGPLLGEGVFTEDGAEWRASRRLLASVLRQPRCSALRALEPHVQSLLRSIASDCDASSCINLRPLFYDYTLDTATDLLLGDSTNLLSSTSETDSVGRRFSHAFTKAMRWIAMRERFKMFAGIVTTPESRRACRTARLCLKQMIIEARQLESDAGQGSLADFVEKAGDLDKARDELMNLLFAARDSTASLLCWLVYALAREPEVLERLQKEVVSVLGKEPDTLPTGSDLIKLRYLDDVMYETLRLFPVAAINGRLCLKTTTFAYGGGDSGEEPILVPEGTLVCFSTYACHRSPKYYGEDAMSFRPERWQRTSVRTRTEDLTFHPFIGGPRKCPGGRSRWTLENTPSAVCLTC